MFHCKAENAHTVPLLAEPLLLAFTWLYKWARRNRGGLWSAISVWVGGTGGSISTLLVAGWFSLLFLFCTWWYLYCQAGGKGETWGESFGEGRLLWTCSLSSVGFPCWKKKSNGVVCSTFFWKATERAFCSFCGIIFSYFVRYEQWWLHINYHW